MFIFRPYWRCYYANTDAVIYVIDSQDRERIGISKQELISMLDVSHLFSSYLSVDLHDDHDMLSFNTSS